MNKLFSIFFFLLISLVGMAQYPIFDHFTSVGGSGEWYNASGQSSMCVESGTVLCYACGTNYNNSSWYSWQSPDYGTQFFDDGCDNINIRFNVSFFIRGNDDLQFWIYDGGWYGYSIPSSGTYSINLPSTSQYFSFDLVTGPGGSLSGKYAHIDWFEISCISSLPIELIDLHGKNIGDVNNIYWTTASEINNDYFSIERSSDGITFDEIERVDGAGNSTTIINYSIQDSEYKDGINYYRLKQTDFNGDFEYSKVIVIDNNIIKPTIIKVVNMMGQEVSEDYIGLRIVIYSDGTTIKKVGK